MRILVTGHAGQLGYDVVKNAQARGIDAVGIDRNELDLTDEAAVNKYFDEKGLFDAIIHPAAYTAVDAAEDDEQNVRKINVDATRYLVEAAQKMGAKFLYVSTDYVYDGTGDEPFTEEALTGPQSVYGITKREGEEVALAYDKTFVTRISWVFGINGNNFIKTMLNLGATRDNLTVVDDQFGSPTYTKDLAILLVDMIESDAYGIYNVSNEGFCSWYEFATEIFKQANINVIVEPVDSSAFRTKAVRPKNSRMSKDKLVKNGFNRLPEWQNAVTRFLQEMQENQ